MTVNFENKIEASLEQLQMDERLRSNLIDTEANLLFDWAAARLTDCINGLKDESSARDALRAETRRIRRLMRSLNDSFGTDQSPAPQDLLSRLGLAPKAVQIPPLADRAALIQWLLDQVSAAQAKPQTGPSANRTSS